MITLVSKAGSTHQQQLANKVKQLKLPSMVNNGMPPCSSAQLAMLVAAALKQTGPGYELLGSAADNVSATKTSLELLKS